MKFDTNYVDKNNDTIEKMMKREDGIVPQVTIEYIQKHLSNVPPEMVQWIVLGTAIGVKVAFAYTLYQKQY